MVEPVGPLERRELDSLDVAPRSALTNDFGFEQPDDRLGERVVVGILNAADRGLDGVLLDPLALTVEDSTSRGEQRWQTVGVNSFDELIIVVWTNRGSDVRLILGPQT